MKTVRVVVAGTVGAGKSTFVRTASDIKVVEVERRATDETYKLKETTTIAFDFGRLSLTPSLDLHIYGTPGQSRFDFMWDLLIREAHAYILLVAANRPDDFHYANSILAFMEERVQLPSVIGLTHMDCSGALSPEKIIQALGDPSRLNLPPTVTLNPNERTSVIESLNVLISLFKEV
jgi:hypothetical protein